MIKNSSFGAAAAPKLNLHFTLNLSVPTMHRLIRRDYLLNRAIRHLLFPVAEWMVSSTERRLVNSARKRAARTGPTERRNTRRSQMATTARQ
jgi:hypothetical protein